jgi:hypothetical protein
VGGCAAPEVLIWFLSVAAGLPGRFHTSLLHWPPAARQSVDHCRAVLCHCGLVLPRTRRSESDLEVIPPACPAVAAAWAFVWPAGGQGYHHPSQSPSKVEGLAEAAGLGAGCHGSICMHLSVSSWHCHICIHTVCICLYMHVCVCPQSVGKKSFSMKCHIACMLHACGM